ncbi:ATP-binding protein [Nonomuraea rubra]
MPEDALALLEPFVHGQGTRVRTDSPGLGLGLSIVRAITHAHQGHLAITARPGGGLDITIDLPHHSRPAPRPAAVTAQPASVGVAEEGRAR